MAFKSRISSWLASAVLALALCGALRADTVIPPITLANEAGTSLQPLSAYTALGCVTVGAATSSLNLTATGGIQYVITGTSQVLVQWATGSGPWFNSLNLTGSGFLKKQGDLVRFVGNGSGSAWACVNYRTVQPEGSFTGSVSIPGGLTVTGTVSISGTVAVAGGVSITGGALGVSVTAFTNTAATAYMDKLTWAAAAQLTAMSGLTVSTQPMVVYVTLSDTSRLLQTSTVVINLTNVAGVNTATEFHLTANGPSSAFYYGVNRSATVPPAVFAPYSVSTTALWANKNAPGEHLWLAPTAAAATVTAGVQIRGAYLFTPPFPVP